MNAQRIAFELSKHCAYVHDRIVLSGMTLQDWHDLPTAAVAIRVFRELSEKW